MRNDVACLPLRASSLREGERGRTCRLVVLANKQSRDVSLNSVCANSQVVILNTATFDVIPLILVRKDKETNC